MGIVAGPSGIVVLDADSPEAVMRLQNNFPPTPMTAATPRGGCHAYYRAPAGTALAPRVKINHVALDVRAGMSYAVCPPSFSRERQAGWRWTGAVLAPAELPIIDPSLIAPEASHQERHDGHGDGHHDDDAAHAGDAAGHHAQHGHGPQLTGHDDVFHRIKRARAYLAKVEGAVSGARGHDRTFYAACVLIRKFGLSPESAWPLFLEWNQRCDPPWDDRSLLRKLHEAEKPQGAPS